MTDAYAFNIFGWGMVMLALGTVVLAARAVVMAVWKKNLIGLLSRDMCWGAIFAGSVMNTVGAGHFDGWW
jgi:hypothetical protein